jgi:hypothetical protein
LRRLERASARSRIALKLVTGCANVDLAQRVLAEVCPKDLSCFQQSQAMNSAQFQASLQEQAPRDGLPPPLAALWWDAKGDWTRAHALVDELETADGMAVHAYLHRKEGAVSNSEYWYNRARRSFHRPSLEDEWRALVETLLSRE